MSYAILILFFLYILIYDSGCSLTIESPSDSKRDSELSQVTEGFMKEFLFYIPSVIIRPVGVEARMESYVIGFLLLDKIFRFYKERAL